MEYIIGKKENLEDILRLLKQLVENDESVIEYKNYVKLWHYIETHNIKYFLAKDNNDIIGLCFLCVIPNLTRSGKSIGFIEHVIIDKNYRKKGIGKNLMEKVIEYAKECNCYKVIIQSGKERKIAHKFYEKIGFNGKSKKAFELRFN